MNKDFKSVQVHSSDGYSESPGFQFIWYYISTESTNRKKSLEVKISYSKLVYRLQMHVDKQLNKITWHPIFPTLQSHDRVIFPTLTSRDIRYPPLLRRVTSDIPHFWYPVDALSSLLNNFSDGGKGYGYVDIAHLIWFWKNIGVKGLSWGVKWMSKMIQKGFNSKLKHRSIRRH